MNKEHHMMYPRLDPSLRKHKRLMEHEALTLGRKLGEVEQLMGISVFDVWTPYKNSYDVYLTVYQKVLKEMNPKYIILNEKYFMELYKPIPQPVEPVYWIHEVHELIRRWLSLCEINSPEVE